MRSNKGGGRPVRARFIFAKRFCHFLDCLHVMSMVAYSGLALLTDLQVLTSLTTQDSKFFPFLFVMVFIKCCGSRWKLTLLVPCRITSF